MKKALLADGRSSLLPQEPFLHLALVGAEHRTGLAAWSGQHLICRHSRLLCVEQGRVTVTLGKQSWQVDEKHMLVVPKYAYHNCAASSQAEGTEILFDDDAKGAAGVPHAELLRPCVQTSRLDELAVQRLVQLWSLRESRGDVAIAFRLEAQGLLLQLYAQFLTAESLDATSRLHRYGRLQQVVEHILCHLDEPLSVRQMADLMCLNPDHFSRMFRQIVGLSPGRFVLTRRMERAQTLLASSTLSVAQVAAAVGVSSPSLFSRQFTRIVGCTPLAYRKRAQVGGGH